MPSNDRSPFMKELRKKHPDKIGLLNTPQCFKKPLPYENWAYDNGCYTQFDEKLYFKRLDMLGKRQIRNLMFCVCPDCVGCHNRTLALWHYYYPLLEVYNLPLAFVAQNGCEPKDIPQKADWIFVGGTDPWKMENIHKFIGKRPVHVGRVNSLGRIKYCESLGVTSVDGSGYVRARDRRFPELIKFCEGDNQCSLF